MWGLGPRPEGPTCLRSMICGALYHGSWGPAWIQVVGESSLLSSRFHWVCMIRISSSYASVCKSACPFKTGMRSKSRGEFRPLDDPSSSSLCLWSSLCLEQFGPRLHPKYEQSTSEIGCPSAGPLRPRCYLPTLGCWGCRISFSLWDLIPCTYKHMIEQWKCVIQFPTTFKG